MLHFARADPKCQRSKRSVCRGMRVPANDRHSRLGVALLGSDDVNNPLVAVIQIVEPNAELFAVVSKRIHLLLRDRVSDGQTAIAGWNVMIRRRDGAFWPANLAIGQPKPFKRLSARNFMNEMQIDVEYGLLP